MKRTGEILKNARENKNLSIHEIGLSLKISSKILKAMEEGDEKNLPAKTFLRGFVQSYANYLNLDSTAVLNVFHEEMGSTRHTPPKPAVESSKTHLQALNKIESAPKSDDGLSKTPSKKKPEFNKADAMHSLRENKTTKKLIISALGLILVGLIVFTKKMIDKYSKEAEVPATGVAKTIEKATPVNVETPVSGSMAPISPSTPVQTISTPTPTVTPKSTPLITEAPKPSPSPATVVKTTPTPTPTPIPTPLPTATPANKPVELIVEALDAVEIEYSTPNGTPQKIKLSAEQVHTFKSRSGLKVNLSNGGAVNLILNGKEVGIPGDLGKPMKLSY